MSIGFYELLQVPADASLDTIRVAYQDQVAQVVRKARAAEARQADMAAVEARRQTLAEAFAVLSDAPRRRRYDRFRELSKGAMPTDPEELWNLAAPSMVDPAAAAALEVVRTLTELKVGDPFGVRQEVDPKRAESNRAPEPRAAEPRPEPRSAEPRPRETRNAEPRVADPRPEVARPDPRASRPPEPAPEARRPKLRVPELPADSVSMEIIEDDEVVLLGPSAKMDTRKAQGPRIELPDHHAVAQVRVEPMDDDVRPGPARVEVKDLPPRKPKVASAEDIARMLDQYGPTGACLKAVREARGITPQELSHTTRISQRFIEALERDAYHELPAATFVRGYVKMVVRMLHMVNHGPELDEFVDGYMARFHRNRG
jgi:DNA-binding XRE family transcriptional regulator